MRSIKNVSKALDERIAASKAQPQLEEAKPAPPKSRTPPGMVQVTVYLSAEEHAFLMLRSYARFGVMGGRASKGGGVKGLCEEILHKEIGKQIEREQAKGAGKGKAAR